MKLKEKMRLMGEYPPEHFLEFSGKPIRRKSSSQIGLISFRMTAIFGQHGSHHIPKRVSSNICTPPPTSAVWLPYRIIHLNLSVTF